MITYKNLYNKLCSYENLLDSFNKAKKNKSKMSYVIKFEENLELNLLNLQKELKNEAYCPSSLKKFIVRDPKTRIIHSSIFIDRIVHHAIINVIEPIYRNIFIYDSFASQKDKGTHEGIKRFQKFMKKVSHNGRLVKNPYSKNSIEGYVLKCDIRKYFDSMNHEILIKILEKKIQDKKIIDLIRKVLDNFNSGVYGIGLPLGNYTSQFLANVYLNELDYFIKHKLKSKYYIRYVDDFVILHRNKIRLEYLKRRIEEFLVSLELKLHPDKCKILPLRNGINFLGYRIFYRYILLRQRNIKHFKKKLEQNLELYKQGLIDKENLSCRIEGWMGYAKFANTYRLREQIMKSTGLNSSSL